MDDFSDEDSEPEEEDEEEGEADLSSDEILRELCAFFGANAEKVKTVLELWNAYADLYNAFCDEWTEDSDAYRQERGFRTLKVRATVSPQRSDARHAPRVANATRSV